MALAPFKHPSVFVGCPYRPKRAFEKLREALDRLPIEFVYADSSIRTQQVMERIRRGITRTDYSLFDITGWNANVTLEVGMAEGLNKDYYILFRPGQGSKSEPPADLKGVQRFQYTKLEGLATESLTYQLMEHLVRKLTHPRNIFDELSGPDRDKMFFFAMRILAHFKKGKILRREDLKALIRGTWLRQNSVDEILRLLKRRGLLKGRLDGQKWKAGRNLYKHVKL
jgi:hypothetical protein